MAQRFGDRQRPWLLAVGMEHDTSGLRDALDGLREATVDYVEDPQQVDQSEYDAVVAVDGLWQVHERLHVFLLGGAAPDEMDMNGHSYQWEPRSEGRARQTVIPDDTPEDLAALARATLVPWVERQEKPYTILVPINPFSQMRRGPERVAGAPFSAFLRTVSDRADPIAGVYRRPSGKHCWLLPHGVERIGDWLAAALTSFARQDPASFPAQAVAWQQQPEWMTADERDAAHALNALQVERQAALAAFEAREADVKATLEIAQAAAETGPRRLLTDQGDDLVDEVATTLVEFGFRVLRPDDERAATRDTLLEDLEVIDGDWNSLAEVRGYGRGGAKTSDLQRIERFVNHYERRTGHAPSARWYVVNHNFGRAPTDRPTVLAGAEDDVAFFAEANGLVIDTRDLFRLRQAVAEGRISREAARDFLRSSSGVLKFRAIEPSPQD